MHPRRRKNSMKLKRDPKTWPERARSYSAGNGISFSGKFAWTAKYVELASGWRVRRAQ
jgi:hypothetical protein